MDIFKLLLFCFFLGIVSCSQYDQDPAAPDQEQEQMKFPDQESWEATIIITDEGNRLAEVWAGYLARYEEKRQTLLKDSIHVDFYDSNGRHKSVLTAEEGIVYHQNNNLEAMGNVIVVSDSGIVLETEKLKWDNKLKKIISDVSVKFTTQTDTLIGDSFISDADLKNYEIRNAKGYSKRLLPLEK